MNRREFLVTAAAGTTLANLPRSAAQVTESAEPGLQGSGSLGAPAAAGRGSRADEPGRGHVESAACRSSRPRVRTGRRSRTSRRSGGCWRASRRGSSCARDDDARRDGCATRYADLARRAIARAVDPASPDFLNFTRDRQPLVDAAFLAQGLLRAPRALRDELDAGDTAQPGRRARIDARDRARLQQLAAVLGDGRGRAEAARGDVGPRARRLRAPAARAVVQGRRRVRRRAGVPLGLLQQLRDSPDAGGRAAGVRRRHAGVEGPARAASRSARRATPRCRSASSARTAPSRRSADRSPIAAARSTCSRRPRCAVRCPKASRRRRCAAR